MPAKRSLPLGRLVSLAAGFEIGETVSDAGSLLAVSAALSTDGDCKLADGCVIVAGVVVAVFRDSTGFGGSGNSSSSDSTLKNYTITQINNRKNVRRLWSRLGHFLQSTSFVVWI